MEIDEIKENDFNLNITRYVDTFEEEEPVDIQANLRELCRPRAGATEIGKTNEGVFKKNWG